jgi:hypothetical protein
MPSPKSQTWELEFGELVGILGFGAWDFAAAIAAAPFPVSNPTNAFYAAAVAPSVIPIHN